MTEMQNEVMKATGITQDAIASLRGKFRGDLIQPSDPQYNIARKVYNAMIDKRPALIVRPVDVADVSSAIGFGSQNGLDVAVRGGGHNGPGFGTVDGGLLIDLVRLRGIRVDPDAQTVRVEGGAVWGDVDHATYPFGLAVPCGFLSSTGVGGLTLGGGIGYLARRYGLTIDNLLSVDMVLADGSFVTADKEHKEDLFWAVRGGGGNFGIVTSFLFKANPVTSVYGGPMFWPLEESTDMLHYWQDFILKAPGELNGFFGLGAVPPAPPFPEKYHKQNMGYIMWCYTGPQEKAEGIFKPIRQYRQPSIDFAGPIAMPAINSMFDGLYPAGYQWYWQADFFKHYDDHAIDLLIKAGNEMPTMFSNIHIYPINGAVGKVGPHETAWGYRDANFSQVIVAVDPDPANNARMIRWAKDTWSALHPYSAGGAYLNFKMDEGVETVKAGYGENYSRLAKIKAKYDPNNFFHVNQNIAPQA
jgi:UDP-N-acetylenolpyruvoylglucosamine reductase